MQFYSQPKRIYCTLNTKHCTVYTFCDQSVFRRSFKNKISTLVFLILLKRCWGSTVYLLNILRFCISHLSDQIGYRKKSRLWLISVVYFIPFKSALFSHLALNFRNFHTWHGFDSDSNENGLQPNYAMISLPVQSSSTPTRKAFGNEATLHENRGRNTCNSGNNTSRLGSISWLW